MRQCQSVQGSEDISLFSLTLEPRPTLLLQREISNFLSNITEHFHHFLLVISRFILFSANIIISIRPVHLGHRLASNFPLIFQELAAEWRGLAISSHPDLVMRTPIRLLLFVPPGLLRDKVHHSAPADAILSFSFQSKVHNCSSRYWG